MSLTVLAIGVSGMIAMQKVTVSSNTHAKNLAIATHIAQSWLGVLQADADLWNIASNRSRTLWIGPGLGTASWVRPSWQSSVGFGPSFDALGNPTESDDGAAFCVDLRFNQLTANDDESGLARVEVRVIWLRERAILAGSLVAPDDACSYAAAAVENANERRLFHFVFMSGAVRQVYRGEGA